LGSPFISRDERGTASARPPASLLATPANQHGGESNPSSRCHRFSSNFLPSSTTWSLTYNTQIDHRHVTAARELRLPSPLLPLPGSPSWQPFLRVPHGSPSASCLRPTPAWPRLTPASRWLGRSLSYSSPLGINVRENYFRWISI
jgi:hypothetical protein